MVIGFAKPESVCAGERGSEENSGEILLTHYGNIFKNEERTRLSINWHIMSFNVSAKSYLTASIMVYARLSIAGSSRAD